MIAPAQPLSMLLRPMVRLMGPALGPQLPPLGIKLVVIIMWYRLLPLPLMPRPLQCRIGGAQ